MLCITLGPRCREEKFNIWNKKINNEIIKCIKI